MSRLLDSALPGFEAELVARLADLVGTADAPSPIGV
jgi:hypothetical protein